LKSVQHVPQSSVSRILMQTGLQSSDAKYSRAFPVSTHAPADNICAGNKAFVQNCKFAAVPRGH